MCAALGGRAAEEVMFGKISTGALSDLEKVTKQSYAMIMYYGLNKKIGNVSYYDSSGGNEYTFTKPYSEKTAQFIDEEVTEMIESAYIKTKELIKTHQAQLIEVAQQLLDNEVIFKEDLEKIIGKRPFEKEEYQPMSQHKKIFANGDPNAATNGAANGTPSTNGVDTSAQPGMIILDDEQAISEDELKQEEANRDLEAAKRKEAETRETEAKTADTSKNETDIKQEPPQEKKKKEAPKEKQAPEEPTTPTLF
jgi:hypothetical protein